MSKYSYEFKKEVVQAYLNGEESYGCIAKQYGISSSTPIRSWVSAYKEFGEEGKKTIGKSMMVYTLCKNLVYK